MLNIILLSKSTALCCVMYCDTWKISVLSYAADSSNCLGNTSFINGPSALLSRFIFCSVVCKSSFIQRITFITLAPKLQSKEFSPRCDACPPPPAFIKCRVKSVWYLNTVWGWMCTLICTGKGGSGAVEDTLISILREGSSVELVGVERGSCRKTPDFLPCLLSFLLCEVYPGRTLAPASSVEVLTLWLLLCWYLFPLLCLFHVISPQLHSDQGCVCPPAEFNVRMFPLACSASVYLLLAHHEQTIKNTKVIITQLQ